MNKLVTCLSVGGINMVRISQGWFIVFSLVFFLSLSTFALIRAENIVISKDMAEAVNESIALPMPTIEVDTINEAEKVVGFSVRTLTNGPNGYERKSILYLPIEEKQYLVRQIFRDDGEGRIILNQYPDIYTMNDTYHDFEEETTKGLNGETITFSKSNGEIYQVHWSAEGFHFELTSILPYHQKTWENIVVGLK